jgi:hypothetical protein
MAAAQLKQDAHVAKLFEVLGPRYKERQGGYVRVLKAGFRYGDMAPMAIIEFVDRDPDGQGRRRPRPRGSRRRAAPAGRPAAPALPGRGDRPGQGAVARGPLGAMLAAGSCRR